MTPEHSDFHGFPGHLFVHRRELVLERLESDAMVLPASPTLIRSGDSDLPYRPDSELFYLTGLDEPESLLLLRGFADEERTVLFVRERDPEAELWTGPRLGPDAAADRHQVEGAYPMSQLRDRLPELLRGAARIHHRLGRRPAVDALVVEALDWARARGARRGLGPRAVVDPGGILDEMRLRKDRAEIEAIRAACDVTVEGFRAALAGLAPGKGEWEVESRLLHGFRSRGATGAAFSPIVAAGDRACVLHYIRNDHRIESDDLVLLDAGAEVRFYAGDISRTVPASGRFTPEQRAVYELVDAARARAIEEVRPGATVRRVHETAVNVLTRGLVELDVLSGSLEGLLEEKAFRPYFPHRTSHWLGLDTHDPGDYARGDASRELEPGMVLTVEPGLYFGAMVPEEARQAARPFLGIGVRIEDDVLVTAEGVEVLTSGLPTDPDVIAGMVRDSASSSP
jgi:Xaa-Pro aminopeptidase